MKITISFRHLEHTPSLDERIHEKTMKLEKYLGGKTDIKWSCWVQEGNHHAEIDLNGPHFHYHASAQTDNLYKTIDKAIEKLEKQLVKKKEKMKKHKSKPNHSELVINDPETAWTDVA